MSIPSHYLARLSPPFVVRPPTFVYLCYTLTCLSNIYFLTSRTPATHSPLCRTDNSSFSSTWQGHILMFNFAIGIVRRPWIMVVCAFSFVQRLLSSGANGLYVCVCPGIVRRGSGPSVGGTYAVFTLGYILCPGERRSLICSTPPISGREAPFVNTLYVSSTPGIWQAK